MCQPVRIVLPESIAMALGKYRTAYAEIASRDTTVWMHHPNVPIAPADILLQMQLLTNVANAHEATNSRDLDPANAIHANPDFLLEEPIHHILKQKNFQIFSTFERFFLGDLVFTRLKLGKTRFPIGKMAKNTAF